jgi:hypothetical protein
MSLGGFRKLYEKLRIAKKAIDEAENEACDARHGNLSKIIYTAMLS